MSTDFIAEEWEPEKKETVSQAGAASADTIAPAHIAALVGGLLLNQQVEEEKLRRKPIGADENGAETSRWKDAGRREVLRRFSFDNGNRASHNHECTAAKTLE